MVDDRLTRPTILVVGDTPECRNLTKLALETAGFRVVEAGTGREALSAVASGDPDVVVLDVRLPNIDGFEVCRMIKTAPSTAAVPVLQLSSATERDVENHAPGREDHADAYLARPPDPRALVATVRTLLRLREMGRAFRAVFEGALNAMVIVDDDTRCVEVNRSAAVLFGRASDALVGRRISDFVLPADDFQRAWTSLIEQGHQAGQMTMIAPDGFVRRAEYRATARVAPGRHLLIMQDVAERTRAETTLRRQAEIIDQIEDAVIVTDRAGLVTSWNRGAERIFGYRAGEAIGHHISFVHAPVEHRPPYARLSEELVTKGRIHYDVKARTKSGETIWLDLVMSLLHGTAGNVTGMIGFAADITRRKRAEEAAEALAEVGRRLAERLDIKVRASLITSTLLDLFRVRRSAFLLCDETSRGLICIAAAGDDEASRWVGRTACPGVALVGRAVATRQLHWTDDILVDPDMTDEISALDEVRESDCRARLCAPLVVDGDVVGVLILADTTGRRFTDDETSVLRVFAAQAALAVRNALLYAESERRRETAEALGQVGRSLATTLDVSAVARGVVENTMRLLSPTECVLYRKTGGGCVVLAASNAGPLVRPGETFAAGECVAALAASTRRPFATEDLLADGRVALNAELRSMLEGRGPRSALCVPLLVKETVIGVLSIADTAGRRFTGEEVRLAQAFADTAAVALANADLFEDLECRRREAEVTADLVAAVSASLDLPTVLQRVVESARTVTACDMAWIAIARDGDARTMRFCSWTDDGIQTPGSTVIEEGKGSGGLVLATGRPFRTSCYLEDTRITRDYAKWAQREGVVAQMVIPIRSEGRVAGLLYVNNRSRRAFTDRDEAALMRLAAHAAIAIANAGLYEQVRASATRLHFLSRRLIDMQEAERRRLTRELHDHLGQTMTILKLNLQAAAKGAAPSATPALSESITMVDTLVQQLRDLCLDLRPPLLDDLGLVPALRWYVDHQTRHAGLEARVMAGAREERLPAEVETACFRVAQEALTNVLRHARATKVVLGIHREESHLLLTVSDDGVGFDVTAARARASAGATLGLLGMEERMLLLGGTFEVRSQPGQGAVLRACVPLPSTGAAKPRS